MLKILIWILDKVFWVGLGAAMVIYAGLNWGLCGL